MENISRMMESLGWNSDPNQEDYRSDTFTLERGLFRRNVIIRVCEVRDFSVLVAIGTKFNMVSFDLDRYNDSWDLYGIEFLSRVLNKLQRNNEKKWIVDIIIKMRKTMFLVEDNVNKIAKEYYEREIKETENKLKEEKGND